ncbi:MAG: ParA family protein [Deltaproteobacteria bacterium]|nr:ParA family protein [Deltaproteobacteria bacterium]
MSRVNPPRVIAVSNQKGGVGKTTTAVNLATALARAGHATLIVDLDPQGNASSGLGCPRDSVAFGVADAILGLEPLSRVLVPTAQPGLDLAPATPSMVGVEVELVTLPNREQRLNMALAGLDRAYAFVILDCPPSLGMLTLNALTASDSVLVPLQAEYHAMEGLGELVRTITAVRRSTNPRLRREGILLTMHDGRTNLCRDVEAQARAVFGREVFKTIVPRTVRLAEAPSHGKSIFHYDPGSRGAQAYLALAEELVARVAASPAAKAVG